MIGNEPPAFMSLALDIGLAGFPLRIELVELEVEVMFSGFAGVDRTALPFWRLRRHSALLLLRRGRLSVAASMLSDLSMLNLRPKNFGPFQLVPVIRRAMIERLA